MHKMEKETVITVKGLSKRYRIGLQQEMHSSLAASISSFLKAPFKSLRNLKNLSSFKEDGEDVFWALRDIDFEVKKGDVLGIVGMNGAGKSTLLKVLARITDPTTGEISIKGRVASLLEVGTGFHPDLTGRENIFLNGTILGMTRKEIVEKMDEIIAFSGVKQFIDTPVKKYSSGMRVRLAFSVAAHLNPEILIIDEVLAVGDFEFQNKCLGKMQEAANDGKTVLFVSHNLAAVNQLCTRAILLEKGRKIADGTVAEIIEVYKKGGRSTVQHSGHIKLVPNDTLKFQLLELTLKNQQQIISDSFEHIEKIRVEIRFKITKSEPNFFIHFNITNQDEVIVFVTTDEELSDGYFCGTLPPGKYTYQFDMPEKLLKPGNYTINLTCSNNFFPVEQFCLNIMTFEVMDSLTVRGKKSLYRKPAIVAPEITWKLLS